MTKELYTIGETAKLLGVPTQTLRFYDKKKYSAPFILTPIQDTDTIRINSFILLTG